MNIWSIVATTAGVLVLLFLLLVGYVLTFAVLESVAKTKRKMRRSYEER